MDVRVFILIFCIFEEVTNSFNFAELSVYYEMNYVVIRYVSRCLT